MMALHDGREAWDIAMDNVRTMLGTMDFTPDRNGQADRAGVVVFRHRTTIEANELLGLNGDQNAVVGFVNNLRLGNPRDTARFDIGMQHGRTLLNNGRASRPQNKPVMLVVSELQAKNVPYEHIPDCEERRNGNEECAVLKVAESIKAEGITIALFATGTGNRGGQVLPDMVSDRATLFVERPNADQIRGIYQRLAPRRECPRNNFWPYLP